MAKIPIGQRKVINVRRVVRGNPPAFAIIKPEWVWHGNVQQNEIRGRVIKQLISSYKQVTIIGRVHPHIKLLLGRNAGAVTEDAEHSAPQSRVLRIFGDGPGDAE